MGAYEIREGERCVSVDRAYQCGIAVYQLAKLRMLEFYYDFLDFLEVCRPSRLRVLLHGHG